MTNKELKRLSRTELLELLLIQTKETERLRKESERVEAKLAERQIRIEKAGDIAHAVMEINGVMEAAQMAAQQYLDNIIRMEKETEIKCKKMIAKAEEEAERIRHGALPAVKVDEAMLEEIHHLLDD